MNSPINDFADDLFFDYMQLRPDLAANLGIKSVGSRKLAGDALPDYSDEGLAQRLALVAERKKEFETIVPGALSFDEQITARVLKFVLGEGAFPYFPGVSGHGFQPTPYPVTLLSGAHAELLSLLLRDHRINCRQDAENYLARLVKLPEAIHQSRDSLLKRMSQSILTPACVLSRTAAALRQFLCADIENNLLCRDFRQKLEASEISAAESQTMLNEALSVMKKFAYPQYALLLTEIDRAIALDEQHLGLWKLPDGEQYYAWSLRAATTTHLSPDEVHRLGLEHIEELHGRIRSEFGRQGIRGESIADLYRQLEEAPSSKYQASPVDRQQIIEDTLRYVTQEQQLCRPLFNIWPQAGIRVEPVPLEMEDSAHSYYTPSGALEGSEATFVLNVKQATHRARWEMPSLCHHEAYPGHHLQLTVAQELSHLPVFRRNLLFNAYLEGWAKYAETIPIEHGHISDPAVELGRLRSELYSTVNLALDTGIHAKRWNRQQASAFFMENTGAGEAFGDFVVDRSVASPGQLSSYKIGLLKVQEYLARFKAQRGERFSIMEFHDTMLGNGALPLEVLDDVVEHVLQVGSSTTA